MISDTASIGSIKAQCGIMNNLSVRNLSVSNLSIIPHESNQNPSGHGFKVANFIGDINVTGVIDPTAVQFTPVSDTYFFARISAKISILIDSPS